MDDTRDKKTQIEQTLKHRRLQTVSIGTLIETNYQTWLAYIYMTTSKNKIYTGKIAFSREFWLTRGTNPPEW